MRKLIFILLMLFATPALAANRVTLQDGATGDEIGTSGNPVKVSLTGTITATAVTVADESTDTSCFPLFVTAATGDLGPKSGGGLTFNSNTDTLTVTGFGATSVAGVQTLAENSAIALDPAGSADGKYTGITVTGTGGATIAVGDLITLDKDDSRWELVDISVAAAATGDARGILGIAVTTSSDGAAVTVLLHGIIRADAVFPTFTIGAPIYASTTGDVVVAQPTTTDHVIRIIGSALTADEMDFDPDNHYTTHT